MAKAKKTKENTFFRDFVNELGDVNTHIADDGLHSSEFTGYVDTGSYMFNALLSGSILGGLPDNKITALAGESATGKTFFALGIIKAFLNMFPDAGVFYYDTEAAVTKDMMKDRGIDTKRVIIVEVCTVEEFRTHCARVLKNYMGIDGEKPRMMMVLDSLGQLSTEKEVGDIGEGKQTRDMTRAQLIRGAFRALSLQLAKANVPLIITNHVGDKIGGFTAPGMPPPKVMGGGCLVGGTMIMMGDGSLTPIDRILVGDMVSTLGGPKEILQLHNFDDKNLIEIEFEDGSIVRCSEDHKFLVNGEYISALDLLEKDCGIEVTSIWDSSCSKTTNTGDIS